jgi:hypothetical protein
LSQEISIQFTRFSAFYSPLIAAMAQRRVGPAGRSAYAGPAQSCYAGRVMDGEVRQMETERTAGAARRLLAALRAQLTLSRFHAVIGIVAGFVSIGVAVYSYLHSSGPAAPPAPPPPALGEILATVQDARTGGPIPDATMEVLTLNDSVVTTLAPERAGTARARLKEGTYRLRVIHSRYVAETRQVEIVAGHTAEVRVRLAQPAHKPSRIDQAVGRVRNLFR